MGALRNALPHDTFEVSMGQNEVILASHSPIPSATDFLTRLHLVQLHDAITRLGYSCHMRDHPGVHCRPSKLDSFSEAIYCGLLLLHLLSHSRMKIKCFIHFF